MTGMPKKFGRWAIAACLLVGVLAMAAKPENKASEIEANKKIVTDMFQMLFVEHRVDEAIDTYFDPDYIQHNPLAPDGAETIRKFFTDRYAASPESTSLLKRVICEGDLCAMHSHAIRNPGERGFAIVDIFRIENGLIAEHWDVIQAVPETSANDNTMF